MFVVLATTSLMLQVAQPQTSSRKLPARLDQYLSTVVRPTPAEQNSLLAGKPIAKLLDADPNSEVAVFGGIWINTSIRRYVEAVKDIENFERGKGFRVTKRISAAPTIEDFAAMRLPAADVKDLRTCRVGNCEVKLSADALRRFQMEIDWRAPNRHYAANAILRQLALTYVTGYLAGGIERLAVYRDSSRPTFVAKEFRLMVDQMPELTTFMPNLRRYLLDYPKVRPPDVTSLSLLAGCAVRPQTNSSYQSFVYTRRAGRYHRGFEDAVRKPLFLDGAGVADTGSGSVARPRILVLYHKPQPVRRLERLRRPFGTRSRPQWCSRRCISRAHSDEEQARALS
jgi:hypothetical protein